MDDGGRHEGHGGSTEDDGLRTGARGDHRDVRPSPLHHDHLLHDRVVVVEVRSTAWLQANLVDVYSKHRGKVICVAGEELFVGDTATEAIALAKSVHPDDDGFFTRYIPKERLPRIYAL